MKPQPESQVDPDAKTGHKSESNCPYQEGCYKSGSKTRTFSIKEYEGEQGRHLDFEETEGFKERIKARYKIEAK